MVFFTQVRRSIVNFQFQPRTIGTSPNCHLTFRRLPLAYQHAIEVHILRLYDFAMAIVDKIEGDIFEAPPNSILMRMKLVLHLVHFVMTDSFADACNAQGKRGKGVALGFKQCVSRPLPPPLHTLTAT